MSATGEVAPDDLATVRDALADEYDVLEELGHGGMAVVFRARERALDRDVAIKVLPARRVTDAELVERFQREARTSARLEHPHIVPIYHVGRRGALNFFVMKLLRGESLAARIARRGSLPTADIRRILRETASALGYAARSGIVHRDVKPDNILFDPDGRCVVTDFGIARSMSSTRLTAAGMSIGTPRYMSPEQARGLPVDGRSDIYSLGVVAYECLTGRVPFDGEDAYAVLFGHIQSPVPRPALVDADEESLYAIVERMLAKEPDDRFQTAEAVIAALDTGLPTSAAPTASSRAATVRLSALTPTRPIAVPTTRSGADHVPQPSPALDAAVQAGLAMLRRQRPKVQARVAAALRPALRGSVEFLRRHGRAAAATLAVVAIAPFVVYHVWQFVDLRRSRCPADTPAMEVNARLHGPLLLVDPVATRQSGSNLDVYYDVCGLPQATEFNTRISVVTNANFVTRLFMHPAAPITVDYADLASGPATRRHRTIPFDRMTAGSYTLDVVVTDAFRHRREREMPFQVRDQ